MIGEICLICLDSNYILHKRTSKEGLSSEEAASRIEKFGPNKLEQKEVNAFLQFLSFMWNPLSWVMEAAAIVSIALANGEGKPPDYPDFIGIVLLLLANSLIGFYEERQAGNAVKALMESLAPECKVRRNGEWKTMEAAELVPGDVISIKLGDVVPADGRLLTVSSSYLLVCVALIQSNTWNIFTIFSHTKFICLGPRSSFHRSSSSYW